MRLRLSVIALAVMFAGSAVSAETGNLKLDVLGELGAGAMNKAEVIAANGSKAGEVAPGASVALATGEYKVVLPIVGGRITKDDIKVEAGRTTTVLITNVAVLRVSAKDSHGKEPGLPVTVSTASASHDKLVAMVSGDSVLAAPQAVDVKVDAPPQGYYWHDVELRPGRVTGLTLDEVVPAELLVQPVWSGLAMDKSTRVVIYKAGTQQQMAVSTPGPEHRFSLDPGDYDAYVENQSGRGEPYAMDHGIHLDSGAKVKRVVPLDDRKSANGN